MSALFGPEAGVAWVFPGQGSQAVGMARPLAEAYPKVAALFETADRVLARSIRRIAWEAPAEELQRTDNAQPALLTAEVAHLTALRLRYPGEFDRAKLVAGHSLGEYAALVAARVLTFEEALRLVAERGRLMNDAGDAIGEPTGMVAILGLAPEAVREVCEATGVDIANDNAPGQVVISGPRQALERAGKLASERGSRRAIPLQVSAAFHSRWMRDMSEQFGKSLEAAHFSSPSMPVVANVTARPVRDPDVIKRHLKEQTYSPVRWTESVQYMWANGVDTFVEIGPGKVLTGLIKRISPEARVYSSDDLLA